jgi:hypothetical protein
VLRFLLWRLVGLIGVFAGLVLIAWFAHGGAGKVLRGSSMRDAFGVALSALAGFVESRARTSWDWAPTAGLSLGRLLLGLGLGAAFLVALARWRARRQRRYVRLRVDAYRTDQAPAEAVVTMFEVLHKRLLRRWWRRLLLGQPAVALEVHHTCTPGAVGRTGEDRRSPRSLDGRRRIGLEGSSEDDPLHSVWLAVTCPEGLEKMVESALQAAYPNCRLGPAHHLLDTPPVVLRLKKHAEFIKRVKALDHFEHDREPADDRHGRVR